MERRSMVVGLLATFVLSISTLVVLVFVLADSGQAAAREYALFALIVAIAVAIGVLPLGAALVLAMNWATDDGSGSVGPNRGPTDGSGHFPEGNAKAKGPREL